MTFWWMKNQCLQDEGVDYSPHCIVTLVPNDEEFPCRCMRVMNEALGGGGRDPPKHRCDLDQNDMTCLLVGTLPISLCWRGAQLSSQVSHK